MEVPNLDRIRFDLPNEEARQRARDSVKHTLDSDRKFNERKRAERERDQEFRRALRAIVRRREVPTVAVLAGEVGCDEAAAADWLAQFTKGSFAGRRESAQAGAARRNEAYRILTDAQRAYDAAYAALQVDRRSKGLPMPNWNSQWLDTQNPHIQEVLRTEAILKSTEASTDRTGLRYGFPYDSDGENRTKEALARQIEESMQRLADAHKAVEKATQDLEVHARNRLKSAQNGVLAAYYSILDQHIEFWRVTGQLHPDYALSEPPEGESEDTAAAYVEPPVVHIPEFTVRSVRY